MSKVSSREAVRACAPRRAGAGCGDEVDPVGGVHPVGGVREHHLALAGGPTHVVEMQVGEQHVGDVVGGDAELPQGVQEPPAAVLPVVDGAHARVHQHHAVAGADQKAAQGELQPPVRVEPCLVRGPGVGLDVAGPQQDVAGDLIAEAVEDRQDLDIADSHRARGFRISSDTTWLPCRTTN